MTFPALLALPDDPVIGQHPTALRVYLKLLSVLDFNAPRDVKAWGIAEILNVQPRTASACLDLLVERGFLLDHGRPDGRPNLPRRFTLAWSLEIRRVAKRTMPDGESVDEPVALRHGE